MKREGYNKNIIQIWEERGKKVPFAVRRWSWSDDSIVIVFLVHVKEYPYGNCYGVFVRNGVMEARQHYRDFSISCAGCYQWKYIDIPEEELEKILRMPARKGRALRGASPHEGRGIRIQA